MPAFKRTALTLTGILFLVVMSLSAAGASAISPDNTPSNSPTGRVHGGGAESDGSPGVSVRDILPQLDSYTAYGFVREPYGVGATEAGVVEDNLAADPFSWYRSPTCVLGVFGGPEEILVTPEGYLGTAFGTLKFYTGGNYTSINERVKTWKRGYLPIVEMDLDRENVEYEFESFADMVKGTTRVPYTDYDRVPKVYLPVNGIKNLIGFTKVKLTNETDEEKTANFGLWRPPGSKLEENEDTLYVLSEDEENLYYVVSPKPDSVSGSKLKYETTLQAGENKEIIVKIPYHLAKKKDASLLKKADYEKHLNSTIGTWEDILSRAATIKVPEEKVVDAYKANIVYTLLGCLDIVDGHWLFHATATSYEAFWMRDSALNLSGLEVAGYPEVAKDIIITYLVNGPGIGYLTGEGEFTGRHPNQWDGHGQAMWVLGHYYRMTRDENFARGVWPLEKSMMEWQWQFRKNNWEEAEGLYPWLHMGDDEHVNGHLVGHNLWAISGDKGSTWIAEGLNKENIAQKWRKRCKEYENILREKCRDVFEDLGVVPPALEGLDAPTPSKAGWYGHVYGMDWGNLMLSYPSRVFDPWGEMVTGSLENWRTKTFEGILIYPNYGRESYLHSYTPLYISETYATRGDDYEATRDLYSHLVHTSATHMASEGMDAAGRWGWGPGTGTMPHGEFSGKYRSFARDMLVKEWNGNLHIGKVYSPAWVKQGEEIEFSGPTYFGETSFNIKFLENGMRVQLNPPTRNPPENIVIHVPKNVEIEAVENVEKCTVEEKQVVLPPVQEPTTLIIKWRKVQNAPDLGFDRAVEDYLMNYHKMVEKPDITLENLQVSKTEPKTNEEFIVGTTVKNTGGAGTLESEVKLYVDNKVVKNGHRELSKGIGFTSPENIISFRRNEDGTVNLKFGVRILESGEHTVTVGFEDQKLEPKTVVVEPIRIDNYKVQQSADIDEKVKISVAFTNLKGSEATVDASLRVDGENVQPKEITLTPGASKTVSLTWTPEEIGVHETAIGDLNAKTCNVPEPPTVTMESVTSIGKSSATLNMSYDSRGYDSGSMGFEWRKSGGSWSATSWVSKSGSGSYSKTINSLSPGTDYEFKAEVKYDGAVKEGFVLSFTTVSSVNEPPSASFSYSPSEPKPGESVSFDAGRSSDSDGDIVSYEWSFGDGSSASGETVSYAYSSTGDYTVTLTVTDDDGATDSVSKTVSMEEEVAPPANEPPNADANGPYSVDEKKSVQLDDTGSSDSDGSIQSYSWEITSGSGSLQDKKTASPTYVAPEVESDTNVTVRLTVTDDDGATDTDTATVTVKNVPVNEPPNANANGPYSVDEKKTVKLDGTGSSDPDGDSLTYSWSITNDPTGEASLSNADSANPTLQAPSVDSDSEITVELTVSDGHGHLDTATATVTVNNVPEEGVPVWPFVVVIGIIIFVVVVWLWRSGRLATMTSSSSTSGAGRIGSGPWSAKLGSMKKEMI